MIASIECGKRSNFKPYLMIREFYDRGGDDRGWRYVESVMPEGNCADWAEKFWDAAYEMFRNKNKTK